MVSEIESSRRRYWKHCLKFALFGAGLSAYATWIWFYGVEGNERGNLSFVIVLILAAICFSSAIGNYRRMVNAGRGN